MPALNSYWLVVHVAAAIVSGGVFTVAVAATVLYLLRQRADRRATTNGVDGSEQPLRRGYAAHLPAATTIKRIAHSAHVFAFPIWTFAVIAGAIWAEGSWGRYWGWDPKEIWAFITWVLFAAYLHAQATAGWGGRKASAFALAGYLALLFNFFGENMWITGLNSYAGMSGIGRWGRRRPHPASSGSVVSAGVFGFVDLNVNAWPSMKDAM